MTCAGIDIGGTKIEAQIFNSAWQTLSVKRVATPLDYDTLLTVIADLVAWCRSETTQLDAVGVASAGLINPKTQLASAANLPISGRPFAADIEKAVGQPIPFVNDGRALALSEAMYGAGKGSRTVAALVIGTGVGGGIVVDGKLPSGGMGASGEFGHMPAPAHIVAEAKLPIFDCGCGRKGCIETYVAGPGLSRMCFHLTGQDAQVADIAEGRNDRFFEVWNLWCRMTAELIHTIAVVADPNIFVLGGGLSAIPNVTDDLTSSALKAQLGDMSVAEILVAQGGDASGARGAAIAAMQGISDA